MKFLSFSVVSHKLNEPASERFACNSLCLSHSCPPSLTLWFINFLMNKRIIDWQGMKNGIGKGRMGEQGTLHVSLSVSCLTLPCLGCAVLPCAQCGVWAMSCVYQESSWVCHSCPLRRALNLIYADPLKLPTSNPTRHPASSSSPWLLSTLLLLYVDVIKLDILFIQFEL